MGFNNIREWASADADGRMVMGHFRKAPALTGIAGWWHDLGMASGSPPSNFFASTPYVSATLDGYDGIFHGDNVAPAEKYLAAIEIANNVSSLITGQYRLYDYVLYYPFIDLASDAVQPMINSISLPRYTDGIGLQAIMIAQAPTSGNGQFTFNYINQNDVEQTSPNQLCTTFAGNMGQVITAQPSPATCGGAAELELLDGDTGIKRIISVTFSVPHGGLAAMLLAKPLSDFAIYEQTTPNEINFVNEKQCPPKIEDGAFLSLMCKTIGSYQSTFYAGRLKFIWTP